MDQAAVQAIVVEQLRQQQLRSEQEFQSRFEQLRTSLQQEHFDLMGQATERENELRRQVEALQQQSSGTQNVQTIQTEKELLDSKFGKLSVFTNKDEEFDEYFAGLFP